MDDKKLTLAEGIVGLFARNADGECEIADLSCEERSLACTFDISFALTEDQQGISVILTANESEEDGEYWMFSQTLYPNEDEAVQDFIARIAQKFGVKPDERIWFDSDAT